MHICKELKLNTETKHIPFVMISAHTNAEATLKVCPADGFVAKPFDLTYLTAVIESLLIAA